MWLTIIGLVLHAVGTVFIAYAALRVHSRIRLEHKIDAQVSHEMKKEHTAGLVGIAAVVIGSALQIVALVV